jgi:hypothetical protein
MAAGLGFKTFATGEVLTAGDVNGYLMQGVLVFASAAARDSAITSPQEGQFAFTKDTNGLWYYDGAAWVASGATGDIEGVTAGVGISGGGTSGTVTVTNSMATAIDAKGDLVVGTGADTFSRLAAGANGTTLVADSSEATGLKWAAASGGGKVLQVVSTTYTTATAVTGTTFAATGLSLSITPTLATSKVLILVQQTLYNTRAAADSTGCGLRLKRGSTVINTPMSSTTPYYSMFWYGSGSTGQRVISGVVPLTYLDNPATTSSTTYTTEMANEDANGTTTAQISSSMSTITLLEIGA